MTIRAEYQPAQPHARDGRASPSPRPAAGWSIRTASITAGMAILLMSALAGFGYVFVVDGLVTAGDAGQTGRDILASQGLFRLGIASLVVVVALDVVIAWALYRVFTPVNKSLSILAAVLRLVYAGVFLVAIGQLPGVLGLLTSTDYRAVFNADQINAQAMLGISTFSDIWYVSQFLFGLHLLVVGYLAYRSGYVPRLLGALLAVAGLGYVADSLGAVLSQGSAVLSQGSRTDISSFTFLGEFLLALWLLVRARRIAAPVVEGSG